jgi:5-methylcytosine-specific restriction protein A
MSTRPLRPCVQPGCPALVDHGRCAQHARQQEQQRGSAYTRGYTRRHQCQRVLILARDPLCRGCQQAVSTVDDHIVPIEQGGSATDEMNQQGVCTECHGWKIVREQRDPTFGRRLREAGQAVGQPAPYGWRQLLAFQGAA